MIKLRVSYLYPAELDDFVKLVKPYIVKIKTVKPDKTQYYKAYITLKSTTIKP